MSMPRVAVLAVGTKGLHFVSDLEIQPRRIVTYRHAAAGEPTDNDFRRRADDLGADLIIAKRPNIDVFDGVDVVFAVGWQFMLDPVPEGMVVFHDSLLPRYRGFAPTVSALIEGETTIGVTALVPTDTVDEGPILAQCAVAIEYPMRVSEAFDALRPAYAKCAAEVLAGWDGSLPSGRPQSDAAATYSLWRDARDYFIDWSWPADRIARFVDAVSAPYDGARALVGDAIVGVGAAEVVPDLAFVERSGGKVWRIGPDGVDVVCGSGVVRLSDLTNSDGSQFRVASVRTRFD